MVRRLIMLQPNAMSIYNLFMSLIVAFLRYLLVESWQKIYNLVTVNNALVRKERRLLPTSSHNLAQSMLEIVRETNHTIDYNPTVDVLHF